MAAQPPDWLDGNLNLPGKLVLEQTPVIHWDYDFASDTSISEVARIGESVR